MNLETIYMAAMGILWILTCVLASIVWKNITKEMACLKEDLRRKVDKEIYDQVQASLIGDIRELKKGMDKMSDTLDAIRISLAREDGAKEEREKLAAD